MSPFSSRFYKEARYIQANGTSDSLLIKSYHARYCCIETINATWNTSEQKELLLTMTETFAVMVEPE